ncbi:exosortase F system-associated membrane protein [Nonlabens sp.]|uniref:exosortase F system-associated membrane protein n=1 Tax=Nonlabens sp. TaxID=1888209 RepID=UPI003F6A0F74
MRKVTSTFLVIISLVGLISVRVFAEKIFYDPFNLYFKSSFQLHPLPEFESIPYILSLVLRYGLNLFFTLIIIWTLYKNKEFIKGTLWVYLLAFIVLISSFFILYIFDYEWVKMSLFYVRRFLIHPILLFILVPGFYFISKTKGKNT